MPQQLSFVTDKDGMLLLGLIETDDGGRDLAHQVAAIVGRFQVQFMRELTEQIEGRSRCPVQIQDLVEIGIETGSEGACGGGLAGADFAGEQAGTVMIGQKLQARFGLIPGLRGEQLLGIRAVAERRLFKTEESFHHGSYSWPSFPSSLLRWSSSTKLMPVGSGLA